ncbi:MAG: sigma-70 family RNA polymerase sigma factor [Ruminococcus sp.]|nr:sigma-70 family RNA polymerase sigma factor [Ruminococcus sp.]
MEDLQIIELYFLRNHQALYESAEKYSTYCYTIAKNILSDERDAEEAVNETWLGAWNSIPPAKPNVLSAYLGGITRNISLNILRNNSAKKRQTDFSESYDELETIIGKSNIEDDISTKELAESINDFISRLPEIQRKIFVCRYWYFDSIEEISKRFGFGKGKVKSIFYRIRSKLKQKLEKEGLL